MAAGSIVISLLMSTGSFESDTGRAEKRLRAFENTVSDVGKRLAFGAAGFAAFAAAAVASNAKAIDAFNDLKDATGSSIENISALDRLARETGGNFDTVSTSLVKFNQVLNGTDEEGKGAAAVLSAIGLNAQELKKLDPAEALRQTAVALSKFADNGDKARAIQVLFGKSIKEVAPFLKDLSEQTKLQAVTSTEASDEAERFGKALYKLQADSADAARALTSDLIPALSSLLEGYREIKQLGAFDLVLKDAAKGFFGFQSDIAGDLSQNINRLIAERDKLKVATEAPDPDYADQFKRQTEARIGEIDRLLNLLNAKKALFDKTLTPPKDVDKPSLKVPGITPKGPKGRDPDSDFRAYLNNLETQIQRTQELSTVEKLLDDIRRGSLTVTDGQKQQLRGLAEIIDKEKELTEQIKLKREASIASGLALEKEGEAYQSAKSRLLAATPSGQLEETRKDIALLTREFQLFIDTAGTSGISEEKYLEAVSTRLNLLNDGIKEADDFAKSLGLTFASAAEDALVNFKNLRDVLGGLEKDLFRIFSRKLVTEPFANFVGDQLKGLTGGNGGLLGGLFGSVLGGGSVAASSAGLGLDSIFGGFFAEGGTPPMGKVSVVGENGPELFIPNTAGRIIPNEMMNLTKPNVTKSAQFYTTINVPPNTSRESSTQMAAEFLRKVNVGYRNL